MKRVPVKRIPWLRSWSLLVVMRVGQLDVVHVDDDDGKGIDSRLAWAGESLTTRMTSITPFASSGYR